MIQAKMITVDLDKEIDIVDFMPTKYITDDGKMYYGLSIVCVQDNPRTINAIHTNIYTDTIEEMAQKINSILDTGMFTGNFITNETQIITALEDNETLKWKEYGVIIQ
jgi:hypothetical protein